MEALIREALTGRSAPVSQAAPAADPELAQLRVEIQGLRQVMLQSRDGLGPPPTSLPGHGAMGDHERLARLEAAVLRLQATIQALTQAQAALPSSLGGMAEELRRLQGEVENLGHQLDDLATRLDARR